MAAALCNAAAVPGIHTAKDSVSAPETECPAQGRAFESRMWPEHQDGAAGPWEATAEVTCSQCLQLPDSYSVCRTLQSTTALHQNVQNQALLWLCFLISELASS